MTGIKIIWPMRADVEKNRSHQRLHTKPLDFRPRTANVIEVCLLGLCPVREYFAHEEADVTTVGEGLQILGL